MDYMDNNRQNQPYFISFRGIVREISDAWSSQEESGCYLRVMVENRRGNIVNFIVSPGTYFVDSVRLSEGMTVTGYYEANAPAILIYPPQFNAVVMAQDTEWQNIKVDLFDQDMISWDGTLKLNIGPETEILSSNNQTYMGSLTDRALVVIYGASTRSIPAQTTPERIIVLC